MKSKREKAIFFVRNMMPHNGLGGVDKGSSAYLDMKSEWTDGPAPTDKEIQEILDEIAENGGFALFDEIS